MSMYSTVKVSGEAQRVARVSRSTAAIVLVEPPKLAERGADEFRSVPGRRSTLAALCISALQPTRRVMIFVA